MRIFIAGYILLILSGVVFYYLISTYSVKISAFLIDFIVVGLGFYISIKDKLDNKLAIPPFNYSSNTLWNIASFNKSKATKG